MLPEFLRIDYTNLQRTPDQFSHFHKLINLNLNLMKYLTTLFYSVAKTSEYKNQKLEKFLCECFSRPTEGVWLNFIEILQSTKYPATMNCNDIIKRKLSVQDTEKITHLLTYGLDIPSKFSEPFNILQYFQKIIKIKNRCISHGSINEKSARKINEVLDPIFDNVVSILHTELNLPLVFVTENEDDGCYYINDDTIELKIEIDQSMIHTDGLHFIINKSIVTAWPLLACRDGNIFIYNRFDRTTQKVFYTGSQNKDTYIRVENEHIGQLFEIDYQLLNAKPIDVTVKISNSGIYNNLPNRDYRDFIGRKDEFNDLLKMIRHRRHFISALDGIGGVGKSAVALELCYRICNNEFADDLKFEYIIWVSAKNTIFKDGIIRPINQAFEHLDQLIDTILFILGFSDHIALEINHKRKVLIELLRCTSSFIILDNLETINTNNMNEIWSFLDEIPEPSKILLTSREYHQNVNQTLRIESLSEADSFYFIEQFGFELNFSHEHIRSLKSEIHHLSSGLPIVIKSIMGQLSLGKNLKTIKKEIESNTGDLAKFCFEKQLELLDQDQTIVLLSLCLTTDSLDLDGLIYILSDLLTVPIIEIVNKLNSLSLIKISYSSDNAEYSVLPLIKTYVLIKNKESEKIEEIKKRLNDYYQLREVDSYNLLPIEDRSIDKGSLIPRKLVDKAMQHALSGEFEQAEVFFKKAVKDYPDESYVWFVYSNYQAHYLSRYDDAISCLKKANEISKNYIYSKSIGDYHLKLKNYQAAITSYKLAYSTAELEKNKQEMIYSIANAEYVMVKQLRKLAKECRGSEALNERNRCYSSIIENLESYLTVQPHIYDGKLIKIFRVLSESYFGLKNYDRALEYINRAIDLSEFDETHMYFKNVILKRTKTNQFTPSII